VLLTLFFVSYSYIPTTFDNYDSIEQFENKKMKLSIWDTAGQEEFDSLRYIMVFLVHAALHIICYILQQLAILLTHVYIQPILRNRVMSYPGAHVFIICFSTVSQTSFENVKAKVCCY